MNVVMTKGKQLFCGLGNICISTGKGCVRNERMTAGSSADESKELTDLA
jgi:hypothetical protein